MKPSPFGRIALLLAGALLGLYVLLLHPSASQAQVPTADQFRYVLERVEVDGNRKTSTSVIKREMVVGAGDVIDVHDPRIDESKWRLIGTGWFDQVELSLRRGKERGFVVLVVHVQERNTIVLQRVAIGVSRGVERTSDRSNDILPYVGFQLSERNLLGTGKTLALTTLLSQQQQGVRVGFFDPSFFQSPFLFSTSAFFLNGLEFFGNDPLVSIRCPPPGEGVCPPEVEAENAVVFYKRYGASVGMGHDLGSFTRFTLDWQVEGVQVDFSPDAASEVVGGEVRPLDFHILDGRSRLSTARFGLIYDRRDNPVLASRGTLVRFHGDLASAVFGSEYDFLKLQVLARHWYPLGRGHLRVGLFAGVLSGDAPFFHRFFVSDLSDLIPSRILGMNLDNRRAPNLLRTAVGEARSGELAGRVDVEYGFSLYRGRGFFRAVDGYVGAGVIALTHHDDVQVGLAGYSGASRIPADMTFDFGLRADTEIGVLQLGFSSLLAFFVL